MNNKLITAFALPLLLAMPAIGLAGLSVPTQPTQAAIVLSTFLNTVLTVVWWLFIAGVVIFFIIIAVLLLSSQGNPEEVAKARRALIWGGIGVFVGVLAFGILRIIMNALGV